MNKINQLEDNFSELKDIIYELWNILRENMFWNLEVEEKTWNELVTWLDRMLEKKAKELITKQFWKVNFLWEEFGIEDNDSEITFIIDPIDWTESFINREFNSTISIWVEIAGEIKYWIVYDFMSDLMYEWWYESKLHYKNKEISLLRQNFTDQIRVLVSGLWDEVLEIQDKISKHNDLRLTRWYGSVALQAVRTWAGSYDWYVRAWKTKTWDIAWGTWFIKWLWDTEILSRDWGEYDHNNTDDWVIVVRKWFKERFLEVVNW